MYLIDVQVFVITSKKILLNIYFREEEVEWTEFS